MSLMDSIYLKNETRFVFTEVTIDELVNRFEKVIFGKKTEKFQAYSGKLKRKNCDPEHKFVQNLSVKEWFEKQKIIKLRRKYLTATSTSIDFQEHVKNGGTVIDNNEGVLIKDTFYYSPLANFVKKDPLKKQYKEKGNKFLEQMKKLLTNSLLGVRTRKDIQYKHEFKTESRMEIEHDDRVEEYHKMQNGGYTVKLENIEEIDDGDETSQKNRTPSPVAASILSKSKKY